jgi:competence protein ComGC
MQKQIIAALVSVLLLAALPAHSDNTQQQKMTSCNADAKTKALTGDARKDFMKTCLSASSSAPAATGNSQQQKMKTCNADATTKGLKGDDRKAFMKSCLSGG